ncbi:MAG: fructosamine kinase family protein, partial [Atopobiaceae bacterium]|nr:fructosamine kinase family protein [Atopobiaceae bacterium]
MEDRIKTCLPTRDAAERIGRALAVTHAAGAPWWGAPPAGWDGAYLIDGTPTSTVGEADAPASWGVFYAEHRMMAYMRMLVDRGDCLPREAAVFEKVAERLCDGVWDAPQPLLVRESGCAAARLHGDLWAGNLLWDADPANATGGALIDPMAHG